MMFAGMPNPVLWGVAASFLNFIPYIGALAGIGLVGLVALISFDSVGYALLPPLLYLAAAIVEGQFITPVVLGRRLELNSVAILSCIVECLGDCRPHHAVPLLVSVKDFATHFEGCELWEFLYGRTQSKQTAADRKSVSEYRACGFS